MGVGKYAAICKCMYIFIIGNQLTTQNNDRYYPETQTACDYHKVGMSVKGRLVDFHSQILRSEVKDPLQKMAMPVFPRQNFV